MICVSQNVEEWINEHSPNDIVNWESFSYAFNRSATNELKVPTLAIICFYCGDKSACALAYIKKKNHDTTVQVKIPFKLYGRITFNSFHDLAEAINKPKYKRDFLSRLGRDLSILAPELSVEILETLRQSDSDVLKRLMDDMPEKKSDVLFARDDAINFALKTFGISINKKNRFKINEIGVTFNEDAVISRDASEVDGYVKTKHVYVDKTTFSKQDEILTIYHANKKPLEEMLGVDLIYVNETRGNIVMVQYKMLKPQKYAFDETDKNDDWVYRPDKQAKDEVERMVVPKNGDYTDYRLNDNPFYFRFVKRCSNDEDEITAFNITLDHYKMLLNSPRHRGKRGGIRISYNVLNGVYLRQTEFIELIGSGYIGTHSIDTSLLKTIIDEVARGRKEIVLAWQQKYHYKTEASDE